jgi:hypothetical protein
MSTYFFYHPTFIFVVFLIFLLLNCDLMNVSPASVFIYFSCVTL